MQHHVTRTRLQKLAIFFEELIPNDWVLVCVHNQDFALRLLLEKSVKMAGCFQLYQR